MFHPNSSKPSFNAAFACSENRKISLLPLVQQHCAAAPSVGHINTIKVTKQANNRNDTEYLYYITNIQKLATKPDSRKYTEFRITFKHIERFLSM
jgi:hypothetical protein